MGFTQGEICYIVGKNGRPVNMKGVDEKELSSFSRTSGRSISC